MSYPDNEPALKALERIDGRAQGLQEAAIDARSEIRALIEQRDVLVAALTKIAAFDDEAATAYLDATGSYSRFDEPGAVRIARKALKELTP